MGRVRVVVDAAVEHGGRVLADAGADHGLAAGVVLDEVRHVVDDAGDGDEGVAVAGLLLVVVPLHHGQLVERGAPVELGALLVELLLVLLQTALLDLVVAELLEVVGEAELLARPDEPLGRVVLVPLDGVAVVGRELVVEVVVALAQGDDGRQHVVARRVAVVEGLVAEPVRQRVDAEGGLLHEEDAQDAGVDEAAAQVAPEQARHEARHEQAHGDDGLDVVSVLPDHDRVLIQVRDVGAADALGVLLHDHPAKVRVEQALADRVRVLVRVGVAVVGTVVSGPPSDRALDGAGSDGGQEDAKRQRGRVGRVSPQAMVACGSRPQPCVM